MTAIDTCMDDRRSPMAIIVRDHRGGNWFWMHNAIITEYGVAQSMEQKTGIRV